MCTKAAQETFWGVMDVSRTQPRLTTCDTVPSGLGIKVHHSGYTTGHCESAASEEAGVTEGEELRNIVARNRGEGR